MNNRGYLEKQLKICMKYSQISDLVELDTLFALGKNFVRLQTNLDILV